MKRQLLGCLVAGLIMGGVALIHPLEAQPPVCSSGGALLPGCVIPIAGVIMQTNKLLWNNVVPTIASGFGTAPSISANNGNANFRINVGTGGSASTGTITLPRALNGWNCRVAPTAVPAGGALYTVQSSSTTTSASFTGLLDNGVAGGWLSGATLMVECAGY